MDQQVSSDVEEALMNEARSFFVQGFDGIVRVEAIDRGAAFWVDGRGEKAVLGRSAPAGVDGSFCLWRAKHETLSRLFTERTRRVEAAFVSNRLQISGDMSVMARLEIGPGPGR